MMNFLDTIHIRQRGGGFWLLSRAWPVLYRAVQRNELANTGPYAHIRHPQIHSATFTFREERWRCEMNPDGNNTWWCNQNKQN